MRGKWFHRLRRTHLYLSVFFTPLLLLFIITGCWQTFVSSDDRDQSAFNAVMSKVSTIHTDDYYPRTGVAHHASEEFKWLVAAMAVALGVSILLGLVLAFHSMKRTWFIVVLMLFLGVLVPALALYFN